MPEAAIGRIVQYVLPDGPHAGEPRPAQVTAVFDQGSGPPLLNLVVTLDGSNDREGGEGMHQHGYVRGEDDHARTFSGPVSLHRWVISVPHAEPFGDERVSPQRVPGTWHWPKALT